MADLKKGATGKPVEKAQKALNVYKAKLKVDGIFGPKTDAATRVFQKASLLKVDGIIGPQTRAAFDLKGMGGSASGKVVAGGKGIALPYWPGLDYMKQKAERQIHFDKYLKKHAKMSAAYQKGKKEIEKMLKDKTDAGTKAFVKSFADGEKALNRDFKALTGAMGDVLAHADMMIGIMTRYEEMRGNGKVLEAIDMNDAGADEEGNGKSLVKAYNAAQIAYDKTFDACDWDLCQYVMLATGKLPARVVR